MTTVNKITGITLMMLTLQLTACRSHTIDPQSLAMRNPASEWCLQRGGQQVKEASPTGSTLYCLLPSGERIEQWALFHRDHPQ
ncbi:putative hemolysin [Pantoea agglomerans]|uniref:putative hemolysin n=1 Tax=Enterobacter agglomerans TaxID=549 RepID=UPI001065254B